MKWDWPKLKKRLVYPTKTEFNVFYYLENPWFHIFWILFTSDSCCWGGWKRKETEKKFYFTCTHTFACCILCSPVDLRPVQTCEPNSLRMVHEPNVHMWWAGLQTCAAPFANVSHSIRHEPKFVSFLREHNGSVRSELWIVPIAHYGSSNHKKRIRIMNYRWGSVIHILFFDPSKLSEIGRKIKSALT